MVKFETLKACFRSLGRPSGTVFVGFERELDLSFLVRISLLAFFSFLFKSTWLRCVVELVFGAALTYCFRSLKPCSGYLNDPPFEEHINLEASVHR